MEKAPYEYEITVRGFPPVKEVGMTPAKARARVWRSYCAYDDRTTFGQFLSLCESVKRTDGEFQKVSVSGEPAYLLPGEDPSIQNSVKFVRPGTDDVLLTHHLDVSPMVEVTP